MNETIPREIFSFFNRLDKNNNREWFNENKNEFKELENEVKQFYTQLYERMNAHDEVEKLKYSVFIAMYDFQKIKHPIKHI